MFLVVGMGVCLAIVELQHVINRPTPLPNGSDSQNPSIQNTESYTKIELYYQILMIIAYAFVKLSIVFFYRRLFFVLRWSAFDIISLACIVIIIIWALTSFFLFLFICQSKIYLQWGPLPEDQDQCGDFFAVELGLVISDLVTDIIVLTLPMPIIWRLRLHWSHKLRISLVFMLGLVATAASITRMIIFLIVSYGSFDSDYDLNQTKRAMFYWSMIEEGLGLISSCLPVLSPLLRRIKFPKSAHKPLKKLGTLGLSSKRTGHFSRLKKREEIPEKNIDHKKTTKILDINWVGLSLEAHEVAEQPRDMLGSAT
ncbi:hypothetical protein EYB25_008825 [Talaromyces marneffei]|nr:hypothetical protein EYB25_008825 [Talaromyces marneffei]